MGRRPLSRWISPGLQVLPLTKQAISLWRTQRTDSIFKFTPDGTKSTFAAPPPHAYTADEIESPSPDGRFAFVTTEKPDQRAFNLIEKESGKVLLRVAQSEEDSDRLNLWFCGLPIHNDSLSKVLRQFRNGQVPLRFTFGVAIRFAKYKCPELPEANIPEKLKRGRNFQHVSALNYASAVRWQKDGSLVVEIESGIDGEASGASLSATRTVLLGFGRSGKARILKSTIKYETRND